MHPQDSLPSSAGLIAELKRHMREQEISPADIAEAVGTGKPWVSKLLNGKLRSLKLDHIESIERLVGAPLSGIVERPETLTPTALKVANLVDQNAAFSAFIASLFQFVEDQVPPPAPRYVDSSDMTKLGAEIAKIVAEDGQKYGKIAKRVLKLLS